MSTYRYRSVVLALGSLTAAAGCSADSESDPSSVGSASVAITQAPSDVGCIEITAQGNRIVTRSFDLVPGASTVFNMNGLPTGVVNFSGKAFNLACDRIATNASPGWVSDVATVEILPNLLANVMLTMRRNGKAGLGIDWETDPPQPDVYEPFGYASGETLLKKMLAWDFLLSG